MISPLTIQRFNQGDERSFREIFDGLYGYVVSYFKKFQNLSDQDAQDVISDIFLALWKARGSFKEESNIRRFVFKCAYNGALNAIRDERARKKSLSGYFYLFTDEDVSYEELPLPDKKLTSGIDSNATQMRTILLLSLQGLKNTEIAGEMKLSIQTVKNLKCLAKKRLNGLAPKKKGVPKGTILPRKIDYQEVYTQSLTMKSCEVAKKFNIHPSMVTKIRKLFTNNKPYECG